MLVQSHSKQELVMGKNKSQFDTLTWILTTLACIAVAALFHLGKGSLLRIAVPGAAFCIALSLYFRRPSAYLGFSLWSWMLTPLLRRVIDWRMGFADQNLVLLTPFLVSGIAILDIRNRQRLADLRIAPFALCGAAVGYGFLVGMVSNPSGEVIYGLVDWLSPMLLGLHLYINWERWETNRAVIQKVAVWALLFMGVYGIVQFYYPAAWDIAWLEGLPGGIASSTFGRPEPQQIRVWSTLNAPGPFASVVVALLFLAITRRSRLKVPAIAAGLYSLMLSLVRTSWLTGVFGLLYFAKNSNRRIFIKVVFAMGLCAIGLALLVNSSFNVPVIQDRLKTLGDLKNDESVRDRLTLYGGLSEEILHNPVGIGLNNSDFYKGYPLDSGPIRMLLNLGWLGTLLYSIGVVQLVFPLYSGKNRNNPWRSSSNAIISTFLLQLLSGLVFIGSSGAMFWLAVGSGLASTIQVAVQDFTEAETEGVRRQRTVSATGILSAVEETR
jgi:hypothetical protein